LPVNIDIRRCNLEKVEGAEVAQRIDEPTDYRHGHRMRQLVPDCIIVERVCRN
jgi:hypothetical protein